MIVDTNGGGKACSILLNGASVSADTLIYDLSCICDFIQILYIRRKVSRSVCESVLGDRRDGYCGIGIRTRRRKCGDKPAARLERGTPSFRTWKYLYPDKWLRRKVFIARYSPHLKCTISQFRHNCISSVCHSSISKMALQLAYIGLGNMGRVSCTIYLLLLSTIF
jgi:hypothetical protein